MTTKTSKPPTPKASATKAKKKGTTSKGRAHKARQKPRQKAAAPKKQAAGSLKKTQAEKDALFLAALKGGVEVAQKNEEKAKTSRSLKKTVGRTPSTVTPPASDPIPRNALPHKTWKPPFAENNIPTKRSFKEPDNSLDFSFEDNTPSHNQATRQEGKIRRARPLSPHLGVYKVQLTSFLSITHRLTEVVLFGAALLWAVLLLLTPSALDNLLLSPFGGICLAGFVSVLIYHLLGLVRHFLLYVGIGFSLKTLYIIGVLMLVVWSFSALWIAGKMYDVTL
ncbi:MAG: succinate dehydrogenase, cytochrome b556 subunit [Holosporaceae bacterium]